MGWLVSIALVLIGVYCAAGGVVALVSMGDDPFDWTLILRWPMRVFFGKK